MGLSIVQDSRVAWRHSIRISPRNPAAAGSHGFFDLSDLRWESARAKTSGDALRPAKRAKIKETFRERRQLTWTFHLKAYSSYARLPQMQRQTEANQPPTPGPEHQPGLSGRSLSLRRP